MTRDSSVPTERREQILDAARDVFMHYGFRRTTLEDIAKAAGLSRTGIYHHFATKEELFRAVIERTHQGAVQEAAAAATAAGSVQDVLVATLDAVLGSFIEIIRTARHGSELVDETNRLCADIVAETNAAHRTLVADVLAKAEAAGAVDLGAAGMDPASAARYFIASAGSIAALATGDDIRAAYRVHLGRLVRIWLRGLAPESSCGS